MRSPETWLTLSASARICASVSSSGSRSSCDTKRNPRTSRSGSSAKLFGVTVRKLRNFSVLGVLFLALHPMAPDIAKAVLPPFHIKPPTVTWGSSDSFGWHPTLGDVMKIVFAAVLVAMVSVLARAAALAEDHAQIV